MCTKVCGKCKILKPVTSFATHYLKKYQSYCKECSKKESRKRYVDPTKDIKGELRQRNAERRKTLRAFIEVHKQVGCLLCPEKDTCCLDFHHLRDKSFAIADGVRNSYGFKTLIEEIKKCVLVCANCHRKIHAGVLKLPEVDCYVRNQQESN